MTMPLPARLLFTLAAIGMPVGAHLADLSPSHIYNPNWPPHALFHNGQTLGMSILLGLMTLVFAWRRSSDRTTNVLAASAFAALYWVSQAGAIFYPGTAFFDIEFDKPSNYIFGLSGQAIFQFVFLTVIAVAAWLALRPGARTAQAG